MYKMIENDKLFSKLGSLNKFSEMKNMSQTAHSDQSSTVDGANGSQQISNYFKTVYEQQEMSEQKIEKVRSQVSEDKSREKIGRFTGKPVKEAVHRLKADKSDVAGFLAPTMK